MKTIHIVAGSNPSARIRYIQQKGESHFTFKNSFTNSDFILFSLSLEDALSKTNRIFIEIDSSNEKLATFLSSLVENKNFRIFSYFLATPISTDNFSENEREFSDFLQLPHSKIYFDYFPKN